MLHDEQHYPAIIQVTKLIRRRERFLTLYLCLASLITLILNSRFIHYDVLYMLSVLFFGLAISLYFKRDADIKFGGLSTFALMLYYSLENAWLPLHFAIICVICMPVAIKLARRGYLGPMLFYAESLLVLPIALVSYSFFNEHLHYTLIKHTIGAREVIYIFMPLVFVHSTLAVERSRILREVMFFFGLLLAGVLFWVIIDLLLGRL